MTTADTALASAVARILAGAYTRAEATRAVLALEDAPDAQRAIDTHALARAVKELPTLVLYAPVPLARGSVKTIGEWCRREISPRILLELKVDGRMTGGCAFAWEGVFYDFSLSYFIEKHAQAYRALVERVIGAVPAPHSA